MCCLTVQETSRGDYPEPLPLAPCLLPMTWMRESLPRPLTMVSQTHKMLQHFMIHFFSLLFSTFCVLASNSGICLCFSIIIQVSF